MSIGLGTLRIGLGARIIALRIGDKITIGADSLRKNTDAPPEKICKIVQVGKTFFASSGLSLALDTGFEHLQTGHRKW